MGLHPPSVNTNTMRSLLAVVALAAVSLTSCVEERHHRKQKRSGSHFVVVDERDDKKQVIVLEKTHAHQGKGEHKGEGEHKGNDKGNQHKAHEHGAHEHTGGQHKAHHQSVSDKEFRAKADSLRKRIENARRAKLRRRER